MLHLQGDVSPFGLLINDCSFLINHFNPMVVHFIYRSVNEVAHLSAIVASSFADFHEWASTFDFVLDVLARENY